MNNNLILFKIILY